MNHLTSTKYGGKVYIENPSESDGTVIGNQGVSSKEIIKDDNAGELIDIMVDLGFLIMVTNTFIY